MQHILAAEADGVFFAVCIDDPGLQCQARAAMACVHAQKRVPCRLVRRIAQHNRVLRDRQRVADMALLNHDVPVFNACFT